MHKSLLFFLIMVTSGLIWALELPQLPPPYSLGREGERLQRIDELVAELEDKEGRAWERFGICASVGLLCVFAIPQHCVAYEIGWQDYDSRCVAWQANPLEWIHPVQISLASFALAGQFIARAGLCRYLRHEVNALK